MRNEKFLFRLVLSKFQRRKSEKDGLLHQITQFLSNNKEENGNGSNNFLPLLVKFLILYFNQLIYSYQSFLGLLLRI